MTAVLGVVEERPTEQIAPRFAHGARLDPAKTRIVGRPADTPDRDAVSVLVEDLVPHQRHAPFTRCDLPRRGIDDLRIAVVIRAVPAIHPTEADVGRAAVDGRIGEGS